MSFRQRKCYLNSVRQNLQSGLQGNAPYPAAASGDLRKFTKDFMLYVRCLNNGAHWWLLPKAICRYDLTPGSLTEQQSSNDLMHLRQMEGELLADPRVTIDPRLIEAIVCHKSVLDRCYYYLTFTDAAKGGNLRRAASLLTNSRKSAQLTSQERTRQLPTILGKALRSGYVAYE